MPTTRTGARSNGISSPESKRRKKKWETAAAAATASRTRSARPVGRPPSKQTKAAAKPSRSKLRVNPSSMTLRQKSLELLSTDGTLNGVARHGLEDVPLEILLMILETVLC